VTLTLNGENATQTVHVAVSRDGEKLRKTVESFVDAYNLLADFVGDQRKAALDGKASVAGDPMVRTLHADLRAAVLGAHGSGTLTRLAGVGIGFDRTGHMKLDASVFDAVVADSPTAAQELFGGANGTSGAFDDLATLLSTYTSADGLVRDARSRVTEQVQKVASRIDALDAQLLIRRNTLQREFIAADQAMQRLQSQVGSLSSLGNQYRLF
jgi:flagellar hook-associated protein 2